MICNRKAIAALQRLAEARKRTPAADIAKHLRKRVGNQDSLPLEVEIVATCLARALETKENEISAVRQ